MENESRFAPLQKATDGNGVSVRQVQRLDTRKMLPHLVMGSDETPHDGRRHG